MTSIRTVPIGTNRYTSVQERLTAKQKTYRVTRMPTVDNLDKTVYAAIMMQTGPVTEVGVNGVFTEDLIAIAIDHLAGFQAKGLPCRENEHAIAKLEEALHWLHARSADRLRRLVKGTSKP